MWERRGLPEFLLTTCELVNLAVLGFISLIASFFVVELLVRDRPSGILLYIQEVLSS